MNENQPHPLRAPKHEAIWSSTLFQDGIGWVVVARFKRGGHWVESGSFLVDALCLGIKNAAYESCDLNDYQRRIRGHYASKFSMESVEPECARKLIEDAVSYAWALGFGPHPEYKLAARVFGGIQAGRCKQQFVFGENGKPFYRRGPNETEHQARRIVEHLDWRCGPGNYDYLIPLGNADEITARYEKEEREGRGE